MNQNSPDGFTEAAPASDVVHLCNPRYVHLELYVISGAPNSDRAIANLEQICRHQISADIIVTVDILDVAANPLRLMQAGIIVTPTLLRTGPLPEVRVLGNLADHNKVERALGLKTQFDAV